MREVEHAQHAEDDGQTARHQKQQHAEQDAVERGYDDQFKHDAPPEDLGRIRPEALGADTLCANVQFGRSILQVVGSTVAGVSIFATSFQPQPVFSSSNGSFSVRSPSEAIYIGWKNWWSSLRMVPLPPSNTSNSMPSSAIATLTGSIDLALSAAAASIRISLTARG